MLGLILGYSINSNILNIGTRFSHLLRQTLFNDMTVYFSYQTLRYKAVHYILFVQKNAWPSYLQNIQYIYGPQLYPKTGNCGMLEYPSENK